MYDKNDYVVFDHVRNVYHVGEVDIEALADATFSVSKGELAIVVGESGAGKTTLLNILGGMDTLTSGKVLLDGRENSSLNTRELTRYRRYDIGFVFQFTIWCRILPHSKTCRLQHRYVRIPSILLKRLKR